MRTSLLGALAALVAGSGVALGQGYYPAYPAPAYFPASFTPGWQMPTQQMPMQQMPVYPMPMQPMPVYPMQTIGWQQMPMQPIPTQFTSFQPMMIPGVPQGYAPPYYPSVPVVRGWPPAPGSIPLPPGTLVPAR